MYIRIKRGGNKTHPHDYLQIVESYREGPSVRQRVIATLGRLDELRAEGQLDGLIKSLCRFSETLKVIDTFGLPKIDSCSAKLWGPPLVFGRCRTAGVGPRQVLEIMREWYGKLFCLGA